MKKTMILIFAMVFLASPSIFAISEHYYVNDSRLTFTTGSAHQGLETGIAGNDINMKWDTSGLLIVNYTGICPADTCNVTIRLHGDGGGWNDGSVLKVYGETVDTGAQACGPGGGWCWFNFGEIDFSVENWAALYSRGGNNDWGRNGNITLIYENSDTTPPEILSYNMTSEGGLGCTNWDADKTNPCSTGDTTPTTFITTDENAYCRVGVSNVNYTDMGTERNCTGGEGTTDHTCTLTTQDELTYVNSQIYLSCKDGSDNGNLTSTSGALSLTITGLEGSAASAIETGIQNALLTGYTIYTDQQIYARGLINNQDSGMFDKVVKKAGKTWAFNYVTDGEAHVGLFNLTPVLYVLEMANATNSTIVNLVETMINATK